jgi:hypothetical protein
MASEKALFCLNVQGPGLQYCSCSHVTCSVIDIPLRSENFLLWWGSFGMQYFVCVVRRNVCIAIRLLKQDTWANEREPEIPASSSLLACRQLKYLMSNPPTTRPYFYCTFMYISSLHYRLCGLLVSVLGYRSGGPGSIPGTTRKKSSGSGTGSTQPREYNWGATW